MSFMVQQKAIKQKCDYFNRTSAMTKEENTANRPDNTAFTQQRLPAWQPMLSAGIVIPGFVIIGLAFIGIGVALFVTSQNIQVLEVGYTLINWTRLIVHSRCL